jgi:ribosomal protein S18 acetylase RimI-like enzyme
VPSALIRSATPADLSRAAALGAQIVRLHHDTNPRRFFWFDEVEAGYASWLATEIQRERAVVLVAELDGQVVGFAYGAIQQRDWSILVDRHGVFHDLCVAEHVRRQGIGRQLALEMIRRLEGLGAERILARAMVQNESAQRLVADLGFVPTMVEMTRESG